ncbi:CDF family Co(II)/Ni(II) efflux transporter DmeF [Sphingomonas sp. SORGH_AS_0879]|uniref:CDF family Co(II)/Ni(II) efflux transporter DmeF n=1 Tax=Sphingomonas sp. SORGH_AS_0879 TaxID=3041790 RepID=UPI00278294FB|nr:CDF family Co(II)/Ni(II) efflux transporter DmeF [Sphingomonas sp. SORGH_AS_0879]MDQ1230968.1 cation diffusion facilitator family transporter [Sphingomonas sp. SORGH_AS_0879]
MSPYRIAKDDVVTTHSHDYLGHAHDENARRTRLVVWLSAGMMVGEIVAGYWTGSMALLADGFHMATHVGALGIAALAYSYAKRHVANPRYSWGTGKVGELAGFGSAMVLGLVSLGIAYESIMRLSDPHPVAFGDAIFVAVLGLLINLISAWMLGGGHGHGHDQGHSHGHHHHGHDHAHDRHGGDTNMRAAYIHVLADALTSVMAILALVAGRYLGWLWLDPAVGLLGAVVIANWSVGLMRQASAVLLDAADPVLASEVRNRVEGPGDLRIHDFHIWRIGPTAHAVVLAVEGLDFTPSSASIHQRLDGMSALGHVTIEVR